MKRLFRSRKNKVIAGICGGIAEYFNVDPVLIRVIAVLLVFTAPPAAFIAYIVGVIIIPFEPLEFSQKPSGGPIEMPSSPESQPFSPPSQAPPPPPQKADNSANLIIGIILIAFGIIFLAGSFHSIAPFFGWFWGWSWRFFLPSILILAGLLILLFHARK
jgi:phage shock protein C